MSDLTKKVVAIESGARNKARGRPFPPGNTLGRGRPKGSRNKAKPPSQKLLDEYAEHLVRKCIALTLQGNQSAMRICMERISPARRGASITMDLPPIRTAQDVDKAAEKVTQAIRRGDLTLAEGGIMMNLLESRSRVIERVQLESRLEKLEENMAANKMRPAAWRGRGADIVTSRMDSRRRDDHPTGEAVMAARSTIRASRGGNRRGKDVGHCSFGELSNPAGWLLETDYAESARPDRTGAPEGGCMLRMRRRIERLEEAFAPLGDPGPPEVMNIHFVDSQKNVVDTMVIELSPARPSKSRHWRASRR